MAVTIAMKTVEGMSEFNPEPYNEVAKSTLRFILEDALRRLEEEEKVLS